jgi:putative oxidoreductase
MTHRTRMAGLRQSQRRIVVLRARPPYIAHEANKSGITMLHVDRSGAPGAPQTLARPWLQDVAHYAPEMLSILRIVVALLFLEHGTSRLFGFPSALPTPAFLSMYWFAGAIELVGAALLLPGLFSRSVALIMSGEMAFAYFISHAPNGFFPILNRGDGAILYCFAFLYIAFAGAGPWSVDAVMKRRQG